MRMGTRERAKRGNERERAGQNPGLGLPTRKRRRGMRRRRRGRERKERRLALRRGGSSWIACAV
jgi:hypothetical protein